MLIFYRNAKRHPDNVDPLFLPGERGDATYENNMDKGSIEMNKIIYNKLCILSTSA